MPVVRRHCRFGFFTVFHLILNRSLSTFWILKLKLNCNSKIRESKLIFYTLKESMENISRLYFSGKIRLIECESRLYIYILTKLSIFSTLKQGFGPVAPARGDKPTSDSMRNMLLGGQNGKFYFEGNYISKFLSWTYVQPIHWSERALTSLQAKLDFEVRLRFRYRKYTNFLYFD